MIIAEAPGDWEVHLGRPLVGPAGQTLMAVIEASGRSRADFYFTNVYKLWPQTCGGATRQPNAGEIKHHAYHLTAEMNAVKPDVVLLLGATATETSFGGETASDTGELRRTHRARRSDSLVEVSTSPQAIPRPEAHSFTPSMSPRS
jgi:uracil-DNA glycosylase family 4